ncbi:DUF6261 family protein [Saccharicrinis aurantiacus]|uniref:DUF6261 family protein n=1 Tax=Saccharicrinis aurantiacus TaxID=1849719 RepID=UPI000839250F|nr:DUF6261 family protein [Saccharicrinis aurantiacus]
MELIVLPRLSLNHLQTITEESVKLCETIPELSAAIEKVNNVLEPFKEGMLKESLTAVDKKNTDWKRDRLTKGFIKSVRNELLFDHSDAEVLETLKQLNKVVDKYGIEVTRLPLNAETAAIDNLLSDVAQIDITSLSNTGITRWIPKVNDANQAFKIANRDYNAKTTSNSAINSASSIAPSLRKSVNGLYAMLFGLIMMSPSDNLISTYKQLDTLVDTY